MSNLYYIIVCGIGFPTAESSSLGVIMKAPVLYYAVLAVFCILTLSIGTVSHLV